MLNTKAVKIILLTYGLIILLIAGNLLLDFKILDVVYIISFLIYFIQYKLQKVESYTK